MRRTPTTDTINFALAQGAATQPGFEQAFRQLAVARAAYDAAAGDPENISRLADAAARLEQARQSIRLLHRAAA